MDKAALAKRVNMAVASLNNPTSSQTERNTVNNESIVDIPLSQIDSFPNHPFRVIDDEELQIMVESIKAVGIQTPAVIRLKSNDRYEMISGHQRKLASELAGLETIPCIIRKLSKDEAVITMVDSNLQRETILPSEKAWSYKMRYDAMKRQAGRPKKENMSPMGTNLRSDEELANLSGDSRNQIHRYIRLTELIAPLLDMVDIGKLAVRPAVEMKKRSVEGKLSEDDIYAIMREEKIYQAEHFKIPQKKIKQFFPEGTSSKTIEDTIIRALELWYKRSNKS